MSLVVVSPWKHSISEYKLQSAEDGRIHLFRYKSSSVNDVIVTTVMSYHDDVIATSKPNMTISAWQFGRHKYTEKVYYQRSKV